MLGRFTPIFFVVALCWAVFAVDVFTGGALVHHGVVPRRIDTLQNIFWMPFLHASLAHITANTVPLTLLGLVICARGKSHFGWITFGGIVLGGLMVWLFGRNGMHVGASGLVFCYFGFLASRAWFERTFLALLISILCLLAYGGMLRGVLPNSGPVSWEGHLGGLIAGVVMAARTPKKRAPTRRAGAQRKS